MFYVLDLYYATNLWACFVFVCKGSFTGVVSLVLNYQHQKERIKNKFYESLLVMLSSLYVKSNAIYVLP
jgi:uncharacterized membrane protein